MSPTSPTVNMPTRTSTSESAEAGPGGEDTSEVSKLFDERLRAYKHLCRNLEEYIESTEKMQKAHGKEYEKVLKTIEKPLREGEMFNPNLGGIAEWYDSIRHNTTSISNSHTETARVLDQGVLPVFKRLHAEIKNKQSEIAKSVGKQGKSVDKARNETQKHVDKLGAASASYQSQSTKPDPSSDPYLIQRGVFYRLNKQLQEENSIRQDLLALQESFSQFEVHVIQSFQNGWHSFVEAVNNQAEQTRGLYSNTHSKIASMDKMSEWNSFVQRNTNHLVDKNAPPRSLANTSFANKDHQSTQPLCKGSLERKSGVLHKFSSGFYVVTPARWLHQFASDDDVNKDPSPDLSLYLPECTMGGLNGTNFTVKGKDLSSAMSKMGGDKDYEFRTRTPQDAETWWGIIRGMSGSMPSSEPSAPLSPASPSTSRNVSGASAPPPQAQASPVDTTSAPSTAAPANTEQKDYGLGIAGSADPVNVHPAPEKPAQ